MGSGLWGEGRLLEGGVYWGFYGIKYLSKHESPQLDNLGLCNSIICIS